MWRSTRSSRRAISFGVRWNWLMCRPGIAISSFCMTPSGKNAVFGVRHENRRTQLRYGTRSGSEEGYGSGYLTDFLINFGNQFYGERRQASRGRQTEGIE